MRLSVRYGSHLPVLLQAVFRTYGPVLEMGAGFFSTPMLHQLCTLTKRELLTVENDAAFAAKVETSEFHRVQAVTDWDEAAIDRPWDVALVDHSPSERRVVDIRRLAGQTRFIVVHDSSWNLERHYHYKEVDSLFKYKLVFDALYPATTVYSNLQDLSKFWDRTWPRTVEWT